MPRSRWEGVGLAEGLLMLTLLSELKRVRCCVEILTDQDSLRLLIAGELQSKILLSYSRDHQVEYLH